ncbi:putative immunity protein [Pseudonocardia sp. Ae150A_Ps1]
MPDDPRTIPLSRDELRAVTAFAVACARPALEILEHARPAEPRPRDAVDAAHAFAAGAARTRAVRDAAWAAHRAAQETRDAGLAAASDAARAAGHAAGADGSASWSGDWTRRSGDAAVPGPQSPRPRPMTSFMISVVPP